MLKLCFENFLDDYEASIDHSDCFARWSPVVQMSYTWNLWNWNKNKIIVLIRIVNPNINFLIYYHQLPKNNIISDFGLNEFWVSSRLFTRYFICTSYQLSLQKKDETEQQFTLLGSKTVNTHENQNRQGHRKKNVLFESHIW